VPQPEDSISELVFDGAVREATTQEVAVANPTTKPWFLTPVLVGDHWRCANSLEVPPNSSINFQVTYYPLTMTQGAVESPGASGEQQEAWAAARPPQLEGSLFFALPTGEALLYTLKGTSTAPLLASTTEVNAPAKALQAVTLPLANWLPNGAQRLNVAIAKNTDQSDAASAASTDLAASTSTFEGTPTVDLPAGGTYGYVLKCRAYVEGQCSATVTFTNPTSGEYMSHVVTLSVQAPGSMGTLHLEAPLRTTARQLITVDNPLPPSASVTFAEGDGWWSCADPCVRLTRLGAMAGNSEGTFSVEYRPLQCGSGGLAPLESETELKFQIAELGTYKYLLKLRSLPAAAEPTLRFEAPLGGNQSDSFQFTSFARSAVTYACAVGQPAFFNVDSSVAAAASDAWEGVATQVGVRFEPQALGDVHDVLTLTPSDGSAPLKVKLQGVARRPQPQGPFDIASGGARDVPVRNVFADDAEYSFTVDHPAFSVGNAKSTIKAKESANCNVKFTGTGSEVSAKLFVSCLAKPDMPPWVFYLRGKA
jgi:hydrocephalus-inducing protein